MWPYYPQPRVDLGPVTIHAFSALVVIAILVGRTIIVGRAQRFGMEPWIASRLTIVMLLAGFAGAVVERTIVSDIPRFLGHPLVIFSKIRGIASLGGLGAGLFGGWLWCRKQRLSSHQMFALMDIVCYALPFAFVFGRLGCALAHDHRGFESEGWLAVRFPEGSRFDLGWIEFLFLIVLSAAFWYLDRRPRPTGFFFATYGIVYGVFRLWLDTLHMIPLRFVGAAITLLVGLSATPRFFCTRR
jgi:phosphatidylglycerol:prolipoprotein diacylglycerol transferase